MSVRSGPYAPETPNPPLPIDLMEDFAFKHPYLPNRVTEQHLCTQTTGYPISTCLDRKPQVETNFLHHSVSNKAVILKKITHEIHNDVLGVIPQGVGSNNRY